MACPYNEGVGIWLKQDTVVLSLLYPQGLICSCFEGLSLPYPLGFFWSARSGKLDHVENLRTDCREMGPRPKLLWPKISSWMSLSFYSQQAFTSGPLNWVMAVPIVVIFMVKLIGKEEVC